MDLPWDSYVASDSWHWKSFQFVSQKRQKIAVSLRKRGLRAIQEARLGATLEYCWPLTSGSIPDRLQLAHMGDSTSLPYSGSLKHVTAWPHFSQTWPACVMQVSKGSCWLQACFGQVQRPEILPRSCSAASPVCLWAPVYHCCRRSHDLVLLCDTLH